MDLQTLADLGEFVGGMFVVVSLGYLAYQVRQNTRSLRAETYSRLLDRMSALQSRLAVEPDLNHVMIVGAEDPGRLTRAQRVRFSWALYELFGTAEFMYHQALENNLPPSVWQRWEGTIGWWLSHPGMRAWWASKPAPLTADFEKLGTQMIRDNRFDARAVESWRRFVAGEGMPGPAGEPDRPSPAPDTAAPR